MSAFRIVLPLLLLIGTMAGPAAGDIYLWTDEDGVKHITNYEPPPQAEVLIRTPEIEYDAEADRLRREADERARLARERRELEQQQAQLEVRQKDAERLIEASERLADELNEARVQRQKESDHAEDRSLIYYHRPFFPKRGHPPDYFRKNGSIYYHRPPYRHHPRSGDGHGRAERTGPGSRRGERPEDDPHGRVTGPRSPSESARHPGSPYAYERRY